MRASSANSPEQRRGRLVVVSGPSGVGKSTVVERLATRVPIDFAVSATTRAPRPGEVDGIHYHFVTEEAFRKMLDAGEFLEWAEYGGHLYGTPVDQVRRRLDEGADVLLDIEVHGSRQVKKAHPEAVMIFIAPPSLAELERRLRGRGDTDAEAVVRRLAIGRHQMEEAPGVFDHTVINDDVDRAVSEIAEILARV